MSAAAAVPQIDPALEDQILSLVGRRGRWGMAHDELLRLLGEIPEDEVLEGLRRLEDGRLIRASRNRPWWFQVHDALGEH